MESRYKRHFDYLNRMFAYSIKDESRIFLFFIDTIILFVIALRVNIFVTLGLLIVGNVIAYFVPGAISQVIKEELFGVKAYGIKYIIGGFDKDYKPKLLEK